MARPIFSLHGISKCFFRLRGKFIPILTAPAFAELLRAFRDAGVQQVLIWPVTDEERQLELFCEQVIPLLSA